jgi:hypothetical protein
MNGILPNEVFEYARSYMDGYEYADNFRWYIKGNDISENEYERMRAGGCCGYVDHVPFPFLIEGKKYYFGFNYGH